MDMTLLIFLLVYVAMGFGKLPGFKVDRTGAAVVGALALMATGSITPKAAWEAIDYRSVGMLFGLMVVSAAFVVSGFYAWTARRVALLPVSPPVLLAVLIGVAGLLSSLLTNDVVVVAMTPLLVALTLARGLNPVPFLLAFCFAANTGSSGTLIGSPQNMIAAQGLGLSFNGFLEVTLLPALLSLPIIWGIVALMYRGCWTLPATAGGAATESTADACTTNENTSDATRDEVVLNVWETCKAGIVTLAVVTAFVLSDWPKELIALGAASVLLINRKIASSDMLGHVDGNLLLLIMGLFVVNGAMATTGLPQMLLADLRSAGINLNDPISLFLVGGALSNIVGNNPAVMLLVPVLNPAGHADALGAALVLGTGFSSNLIVFGSLAGIIVVEQAATCGVKISFGEFARAGVPVTLACMVLAAGWILML
ncbi:SLC13 family permease [Corticimicrobacter populi]|uniref:Transporter n=1 Tax=Corticimicrobacter populi TaxID=2175229 RepID=A0A2V1K5G9_9BURK|nr:SLC13 family permease [Corticimicrobacter populi]PWF24130.1 transporter [Corticimicrobacter populi]